MPKYFFTILIGLNFWFSTAQTQGDSLRSPLGIPLYLSGTFAELRSNHFHSGMDIKTNGKEGYRVYAVADGYVYRIKISRGGYGKAIYIKHNNGLISVYGHLKYFNNKIDNYIRKKQYRKKSFEIEVFPYKIELPVKKGEVIAYSGNTGGSMGAHLHFEVRNMKEHPLNPMEYGIVVKDTVKPVVKNVFAYPLDSISHINQIQHRVKLNLKKINDNLYETDPMLAYGSIGLGIEAFDRQTDSWNKNGLYKVQVLVNGLKIYEHVMSEFSFARSHYINTFIDYEYYEKYRKRIQKLWVEPYNLLEIYAQLVNEGIITIKNKKNYYISILVSDFNKNTVEIKIPVYGRKAQILEKSTSKRTPYFVQAGKKKSFSFQKESITFQKTTAYYDFYLQHKDLPNGFELGNKGIPLHRSMIFKYDASRIPDKLKKYAFIGKVRKRGLSALTTKLENDSLVAYSKYFGTYQIGYDSIAPKIKEKNFKKKGKLTNYRFLKLRIWDDKTGIKSYNGYIDGKWILFEYDYKTSTITYHFDDIKLQGYKHRLKVVVSDAVGNTATYETIFYRKP